MSDFFSNWINDKRKKVLIILHDERTTIQTDSSQWNDEKFVKFCITPYMISERPSLQQGVACAKKFLNWYIFYDHDLELSTVQGLLLSMRKPRNQFQEWLIPPGYINADSGKSLDAFVEIEKAAGSAIKAKTAKVSVKKPSKQWYNYVWYLLSQKQYSQQMINYIGYIAITLLRDMVQEPNDVSRHIKTGTTSQFLKFWGDKIDLPRTAPPSKESCYRFKIDKIVLAMVVYAHWQSKDTLIQKALNVACLIILNKDCMGCFNLLNQAADHLKVKPELIMSFLDNKYFDNVNTRINFLLREYVDPAKEEYCWPWAKLLDVWETISIPIVICHLYSMVLIAIISKGNSNHYLWNSRKLKGYEQFRPLAKALGKDITEKIKTTE